MDDDLNELLAMLVAASHDERLSTGALYSRAAAMLEQQYRELAAKGAEMARLEKQLKFLCSRMFAVELSPDGQHKWIFRNLPLVGPNIQAAIDSALAQVQA